MALIEDADKAKRLARAIASDISVYNEEKVKAGIMSDNFFSAMQAELDEGRELYRSRVSAALDPEAHDYWAAVVNVIIRSKGHLSSKMW